MKYVINHSQLAPFIRRRFSIEELNQIIGSVKEQIEDGESVDTAVYDTIRHYLSLKTLPILVTMVSNNSIGILILNMKPLLWNLLSILWVWINF